MNDNDLRKRLDHVQKGLLEIGEHTWALTIQDARGELARLSSQVESMREALKPFAEEAAEYPDLNKGNVPIDIDWLRVAVNALQQAKP